MKNEIDQTVGRIADLDLPEKNDILYEENSNGANYGMCDHYSFCTVADLKALATAYTQLKADLATAKQEIVATIEALPVDESGDDTGHYAQGTINERRRILAAIGKE